MKRFGEKLRQLRLKHSLSYRQLAEEVGVYHSYLARIEKGAKPSIETILKISEIFDVSTDVLMKDHLELEEN